MRRGRLILITGVALAIAGCGSTQNSTERAALAGLSLRPQQVPASASVNPISSCGPLTASLRPPGNLPAPGAMPAGSYMARIKRRGYLIAGVNAGLLGFGYLNPFTGNIEGFEIDLARQVARAIFGNPNDIQLKALTVPERIPFVQDGNVDIVIDAVTITCARRQQVDFSTVYYDAHQRVLVPSTSRARGLQDLGGKRVCASAQSAPIPVIQNYPSHPIAVGAPQAIDCLVYLQQGRVDAISTDDSILEGFKAQDPYTKLIGPSLADVPYGMAISKNHPDFVRFVNGVLAQLSADGGWRQIASQTLGGLGPVPAPPRPVYSG
ncbi:MAG: glutamate ABC transporter substrate-binding protein [Solirubrobacterales bacterium]|nr:glutamate ABC transporter substrate-binding protein [Solirubrobacterales bacterium]